MGRGKQKVEIDRPLFTNVKVQEPVLRRWWSDVADQERFLVCLRRSIMRYTALAAEGDTAIRLTFHGKEAPALCLSVHNALSAFMTMTGDTPRAKNLLFNYTLDQTGELAISGANGMDWLTPPLDPQIGGLNRSVASLSDDSATGIGVRAMLAIGLISYVPLGDRIAYPLGSLGWYATPAALAAYCASQQIVIR